MTTLAQVPVTLLGVCALAVVTLAGFVALADQEMSMDGTAAPRSLDIVLGQNAALVTYSNMAPEDSAGPRSLRVVNNGALDLAYAMSSTVVSEVGAPSLGDELGLIIWEDVGQDGCEAGPGTYDDSVALYGPAELSDGALAARPVNSGDDETHHPADIR